MSAHGFGCLRYLFLPSAHPRQTGRIIIPIVKIIAVWISVHHCSTSVVCIRRRYIIENCLSRSFLLHISNLSEADITKTLNLESTKSKLSLFRVFAFSCFRDYFLFSGLVQVRSSQVPKQKKMLTAIMNLVYGRFNWE